MTHLVMVDGAWLSSAAWEPLVRAAKEHGLTAVTSAWPLLDGPPERLRAAPPEGLGRIGVDELREHYRRVLAGLPVGPDDVVLVGHSTGGLVALQLLDLGLARAAAVLAPLPSRGIAPHPREVRSTSGVLLRPWAARAARPLSRSTFHRRFTHGLDRSQADRLYDQQVVPAPHRIVWQVATSAVHRATRVTGEHRRPVLVLGGDQDRMVAPASVRAVVRRLERGGVPVRSVGVPGAGHHLLHGSSRDLVVREVLSAAG